MDRKRQLNIVSNIMLVKKTYRSPGESSSASPAFSASPSPSPIPTDDIFIKEYFDNIWTDQGVHRHDYCESLANSLIAKYGQCKILDIGTGCGFLDAELWNWVQKKGSYRTVELWYIMDVKHLKE